MKTNSYIRMIRKSVKLVQKKGISQSAQKTIELIQKGELLGKIKHVAKDNTVSKKDLNKFKWLDDTEPDKIWAFCAGQYSNDFRGNPKYLFIYINKYRPDIKAYWICDDENLIKQIRDMGYRAYQLGTQDAERVMESTGVLVAEQVKVSIPNGLRHAKYLNLWHGVGGVKAVERSLTEGRLAYELMPKYINRNSYYANYEIYLAPSAFIEDIAIKQLGVPKEHIIHAGYPRNRYQRTYERVKTFPFDPIKERHLPEDTKMVAYVPTYRNNPNGELFAQAIPDMQKMIEVCEKNHLLMIFKMHPLIEGEMSFIQARETYKDCPWLIFWDNSCDFYEVMDQMDLCIMDFSSIFTDFIASGVKHYLRYIFDIDPETLDFPLGYDEATLGRKCVSYDELLQGLEEYTSENLDKDIERISALYWEFDSEDSMDVIIDSTVNMVMENTKLPTLYSFDIFDTLISRKGLAPESIFYWVKERMEESHGMYEKYLIDNYPSIRKNCELNCREYYRRSVTERGDDRCEIQFTDIFKRMQILYNLSEAQIDQLMEWELAAEIDNTIPLHKQITYVKELLSKNEKVILISDMYLPKDVIQKMLAKADPVLTELPLFLSSEYGHQKSDKSLFLDVFKSFEPYYYFGRWVHHGDNPNSDGKLPEALKINTVKIEKPDFNEFETKILEKIPTYDAYLIAAKMARFREEHSFSKEEFVYSYVSLLFVPYVYWAVHDALERGDEMLYFVSRDGHHLKRIADMIIEEEKLPIGTRYIYASRRAWRIPSFIDHIDIGFWGQGYGNFGRIASFEKLLKALNMNEKEFHEIFPELASIDHNTEFTNNFVLKLIEIFKGSTKYKEYLLAKAAEERVAVCGYLKQEIDITKQFSIVEYWGRGYTQENFTRLWQQVAGKDVPSVFYYSRSTLPSDQYNIRRNFTCNPNPQHFIEAIFANIPYRSIEKYQFADNKWIPEINDLECDTELFNCMTEYLPMFAKDFCEIPATDRIALGRGLIDFAIGFYWENQDFPLFNENLGHLIDSVELYGNKVEYAKELMWEDIERINQKVRRNQISKNFPMSFARSKEEIQNAVLEKFQLRRGEDVRYGTWLTEEEIQKNRKFAEEKKEFENKCKSANEIYKKACQDTEVKNLIICLGSNNTFESYVFAKISDMISAKECGFEAKVLNLDTYKAKTEKLMAELSGAKYILLEKPQPEISGIQWRRETKLIMLGDTACYFQPARLMKNNKLREQRELNKMKDQIEISALQSSSAYMEKIMRKVYSVNLSTDYSLKGCCATDCYFDEEYRGKMKAELLKVFPEAADKKIICYAPKHRFRSAKAKFAEMLDLEKMQKLLGDEYVVLVSLQKTSIENIINIPGFSKNMTDYMPLRALIAIADIVIGDYQNLIFETVLTGKPLFLTSWDYSSANFRKNALFAYEKLLGEMAVDSTEDLISRIKDVDMYQYSAYEKFRKEYMSYCDGNSLNRLYEYLLEYK